MTIEEGQIYEGTATLSGAASDRTRRWIVVAPFGKTHIHSIDDPDELHCWPLSVVHSGLEQGTLHLAGSEPNHPIVLLQRVKEAHGIADGHLGLHGERLARMLELLQEAIGERTDYVPYIAAEIRGLLDRSRYDNDQVAQLEQQLAEMMLRQPA